MLSYNVYLAGACNSVACQLDFVKRTIEELENFLFLLDVRANSRTWKVCACRKMAGRDR